MVELAGAIDDLDDQSLDFGDMRPAAENAVKEDNSEGQEETSDSYLDDDFEEEEMNEELKRTALEFASKLTELEIENS